MKKILYIVNNNSDEITWFLNLISNNSTINQNNTITMKYRHFNYDI